MKQRITQDQWNELSDEDKNKLLSTLKYYRRSAIPYKGNVLDKRFLPEALRLGYNLFTIGQMIEFLGDDLVSIYNGKLVEEFVVTLLNSQMSDKELCNALWEAVKYKLTQ